MYLYQQACLAGVRGIMRCLLPGVAVAALAGAAQGAGQAGGRDQQRIDEASRREAAALVELVDRAEEGQGVPAGLVLGWRHDFLKAQPGTFVPFVLTVAPSNGGGALARQGLMYVRASRRETAGRPAASDRRRERPRYAFDAVFAVDLEAEPGRPATVTRGFAVPAGEYDVYVALRERPREASNDSPRAGVLRQVLRVPDFWSGEFTTSTVMLARRIRKLSRTLSADEALERPYAIGLNDVEVAVDASFPRDGELVVVFVIYDAAVGRDGEFDVQVDYHVYARGTDPQGGPEGAAGRAGERYVTRTNPQRFNPRTLRHHPEGDAGPIMAGQGILLSSFAAGEYRLVITVRDLLSGKTVERDALFRVVAAPAPEPLPRRVQ